MNIRRESCLDFLESIGDDPRFLECVITGVLDVYRSARNLFKAKKFKNWQLGDQMSVDLLFE